MRARLQEELYHRKTGETIVIDGHVEEKGESKCNETEEIAIDTTTENFRVIDTTENFTIVEENDNTSRPFEANESSINADTSNGAISTTTKCEKWRSWSCPELAVFMEYGPQAEEPCHVFKSALNADVAVKSEQVQQNTQCWDGKGNGRKDQRKVATDEKQVHDRTEKYGLLAEQNSILRSINERDKEKYDISMLRSLIDYSIDEVEKAELQQQLVTLMKSIRSRNLARDSSCAGKENI